MSTDIKSEYVDIGGSNVLLVSVKGGNAVVGTCNMGHDMRRGDLTALNKVFYIGGDPVISMICPNNGDKRTDRLVSICTSFDGIPMDMQNMLKDVMNNLNRGDSLENSLREVFMLLSDGVYTVYTSEYYPTDGSSTFFWGAYNIPHEVHGTAPYNRTIGKDRTYRPCYLVPGNALDFYTVKKRSISDEAVKSRKIQGIVYHLSGLHSVIIKGHHAAVSCAAADLPFRCAVIEKISDTYFTPYKIEELKPQHAEGEAAEGAEQAEAKPVIVPNEREGITGYRSASVKIPLELMPKEMLRILLETRMDSKPPQYSHILQKLNMVRKKTLTNNTIPKNIHEKCELMPDCEMIESAYAVDDLTEPQLAALLSGDVELDGKVIISPNFYSSIVTACNYLQFHDETRFIDFAIAIMDNPDLYATHEYIAKRVSRLSKKKIYTFFKTVLHDSEGKYEKILATADRYVKDYDVRHA